MIADDSMQSGATPAPPAGGVAFAPEQASGAGGGVGPSSEPGGGRYVSPVEREAMISALGDVVWCFLGLEEAVMAILRENNQRISVGALQMEAGGRERALEKLRRDLTYRSAPPEVLLELDTAIAAFGEARAEYFRAISRVQPLRADTIAHDAGGQSFSEGADPVAIATELRGIARRLESTARPIDRARRSVRALRDPH